MRRTLVVFRRRSVPLSIARIKVPVYESPEAKVAPEAVTESTSTADALKEAKAELQWLRARHQLTCVTLAAQRKIEEQIAADNIRLIRAAESPWLLLDKPIPTQPSAIKSIKAGKSLKRGEVSRVKFVAAQRNTLIKRAITEYVELGEVSPTTSAALFTSLGVKLPTSAEALSLPKLCGILREKVVQ